MQYPKEDEDIGGMPDWLAKPLGDAIARKLDAGIMSSFDQMKIGDTVMDPEGRAWVIVAQHPKPAFECSPADLLGFEPFGYAERS